MDEAILSVAARVDVVYGPLVDAQEFPKAVDVTMIEGAVSSAGRPGEGADSSASAASWWSRWAIARSPATCPACAIPFRRANCWSASTSKARRRTRASPPTAFRPLLRQAVPVHQVVKVDLHVPGCPPPASAIAFVLGELLEGRMPDLTAKVKFG